MPPPASSEVDWKFFVPFILFALAQVVALVIWGSGINSRMAVHGSKLDAHEHAINNHEGHLGNIRTDIAATRSNIEHINSFLTEMRGQLAVIVKKLFDHD